MQSELFAHLSLSDAQAFLIQHAGQHGPEPRALEGDAGLLEREIAKAKKTEVEHSGERAG